jgi:hypothetical protein
MKKMTMNINITGEESTNNDFLLIFEKWKQRPNRLIIHDTFTGKEFEDIINTSIKEEYGNLETLTELLPDDDNYVYNQRVLLQITESIFASFVKNNMHSENFLVNDVCFYYKSQNEKESIDKIVLSLMNCIIDYVDDSDHKINVLNIVDNNLDLSPLFFEKSKFSLESLYNHKTIKEVKKIVKEMKSKDKGLTILYGDKGVGKTNLSKYISTKIDRLVVYVPLNTIESSINSSDFKTFLKKYNKCLLIVDDCEFLYNPMYGKHNYFSINVLQLIDSVISDDVNLQILLIFNVDEEDDIDSNLIDSNNLISVLEIEELESEVATELSKELGFNKKFKKNTRLVEVFHNNNKVEKNNLGFN